MSKHGESGHRLTQSTGHAERRKPAPPCVGQPAFGDSRTAPRSGPAPRIAWEPAGAGNRDRACCRPADSQQPCRRLSSAASAIDRTHLTRRFSWVSRRSRALGRQSSMQRPLPWQRLTSSTRTTAQIESRSGATGEEADIQRARTGSGTRAAIGRRDGLLNGPAWRCREAVGRPLRSARTARRDLRNPLHSGPGRVPVPPASAHPGKPESRRQTDRANPVALTLC